MSKTPLKLTDIISVTISEQNRDAVISWAVLGAALALFFFLAKHMAPYLAEDAFISYRYAENLGNGYGLTFNINEAPVEGYSNLLWILIAALVISLGQSVVLWMPLVGVSASMLTVIFLWLMYRRRNIRPARMILPLAIFCTSGPFMLYVVSGFETSLFSLLLVMLLFTLDNVLRTGGLWHWLSLTFVGILLFLTRPEGIVAFPAVVGLVLLFNLREHNLTLGGIWKLWPALLMSALFILSLGVYTYWRSQYFHELLPLPFLSKAGAGSDVAVAWSMNAGMYFGRQEFDQEAVTPWGYYYLALALAAICGLFASCSQRPEKNTEVIGLVLIGMFSLIYVNFVDWYPAMRYYSALTPLFFLPGVWAGVGFNRRSTERAGDPRRSTDRRTQHISGYVMVGMALLVINFGIFKQVRVEAVQSKPLHSRLGSLAEWLKDSIPAGSLLATPDVGMVPYYSGLPTLDMHPEALVDLHIAKEGFSLDYFFARDPSVVLLSTRRAKAYRETDQQVLNDPRLFEHYRLMGVFRLGWFDAVGYRVYVKNNIEICDEQAAGFPIGLQRI